MSFWAAAIAGRKSFIPYRSSAAAPSTAAACSCSGNVSANLSELATVAVRAAVCSSSGAVLRFCRCAKIAAYPAAADFGCTGYSYAVRSYSLRRLGEVLVLEQQVGHLVVDRRRVGLLREGGQVLAVPAQRLRVVRGLLRHELLVLVLRVVVVREVLQVALEVAQHLRRLVDVEVTPVLGLQRRTSTRTPSSPRAPASGSCPWRRSPPPACRSAATHGGTD